MILRVWGVLFITNQRALSYKNSINYTFYPLFEEMDNNNIKEYY